jgi:hypothetical protein
MGGTKLFVHMVLQDIREGLGDVPIMEKYGLSPKDYMEILEELTGTPVAPERIARLAEISDARAAVNLQMRSLPRCYIYRDLSIHDDTDPASSGSVNDLSEHGIQVVGIPSQIGEIKTFVVTTEPLPDQSSVVFQATCRWVNAQDDFGEYVAGYEITRITHDDVRRLRQVINQLSLCDASDRT